MFSIKRLISRLMVVTGILFAFGMTACDDSSVQGSSGGTGSDIPEARSSAQRVQPNLSDQEIDEFVQGNNDFALRMYQNLKSSSAGQGANIVFSPYSISEDLGMVYAGAEGQTETAMAQTLGFTLPEDRIHEGFDLLDMRYSSDATGFVLNVANSVWASVDWTFLQDFLDTLAKYYGAGIKLVDFAADPDGARQTINRWVEDKTHEKIKDLLPPGSITGQTVMVLVNAIYLKADWLDKFNKAMTFDGTFHAPDGDVTVPFMNGDFPVASTHGDGYVAVRLPYVEEDYSMMLILPDATRFSSVEDELDATMIDGIAEGMQAGSTYVVLPKFRFSFGLDLTNILKSMGMEVAFSGDADFSGMDGERDLFISRVVHKAFIAVDEDGTEAAAATGTLIDNGSGMEEIITFDRPFIFVLRDDATGQILFMGRVLEAGDGGESN